MTDVLQTHILIFATFVPLRCMDMHTSIFFRHVFKGRQCSCLPVCLPGGRSLLKMRSTLNGKNLLRWEQILSFKRLPQFIWEATMKMTGLLPLKVYPFTLMFMGHPSYFPAIFTKLKGIIFRTS